MKAVIYARYSSDNQREESIEGQLRECKEYADKNGITILCSYIDRALSAKTDNRPEFQKMVQDSAKGLFDTVLVWKLDRFARNRYDSAHYKAVLRRNGVKVVSATENISDGPEGIILGIYVGRNGGILFSGAGAENQPGPYGKCVEGKKQRRRDSARLSTDRRPTSQN